MYIVIFKNSNQTRFTIHPLTTINALLIITVCCTIEIVYCAINNNTEIINNYVVNTIFVNDHKHPVRLFNYVFPRGLYSEA